MSYNISKYTLSLSLSSASRRLAVSFFSWSPSVGPSLSVSLFLSLLLSLCLCVTSPVFLPSLFLLCFRVQIAIRAIVDDYESRLLSQRYLTCTVSPPQSFCWNLSNSTHPFGQFGDATVPPTRNKFYSVLVIPVEGIYTHFNDDILTSKRGIGTYRTVYSLKKGGRKFARIMVKGMRNE